ncbi:MAG: DegV family protein [Erysipelotrichaceae bacterium]|nr:DegV family protein [Erysipelotrichaceae bacterium]
MSFVVFADGTANLPKSLLGNIRLLPCSYLMEEEKHIYEGDVDSFDGHAYYQQLKEGKTVKTSLLNTYLFEEHFKPVLESGTDIIYVSMSSGISGTYQAAKIAAEELMEEYPERTVRIIDSRGCGFGNGLLAIHGDKLAGENLSAKEAADILDERVPHTCQYFTVDDLNFLKRTGRVKGSTAAIGTMLNIKPILYGTAEGQIVDCGKVRGRQKSIKAIAEKYAEKVTDANEQLVCISHGDCIEDAQKLADLVNEIARPKELVICQHEPFSGSHVGPGMLGLFFYGKER